MSEVNSTMDYQTFRAEYEAQHPASIPQPEPVAQQYPGWVKWALLGMFLCASLLSAVHTVPTVYQGIDPALVNTAVRAWAAGLSFVFVELMILLSAYLAIRDRAWGVLVGGFTFVVAALANVQSALHSMNPDNLWTTVVGVLVGLLAPVACLAAGKLFVNIQHSEVSASVRAHRALDEKRRAWDDEILAAFQKAQKRTVRPVSVARPADAQPDNRTVEPTDTGEGQRRTDARAVVWRFLEDNPASANMTVREIADLLKVGKSTVSEVMRDHRQQRTTDTRRDN
jgi:hypothetical protein